MTRYNNVCYKDDEKNDDKESRWDIDRRRDREDRLINRIRVDEEKERNDKFNFWIYVAFIVLGIILLVVLIFSIVSLFQNKSSAPSIPSSNIITPLPSQPPSIKPALPSQPSIKPILKKSSIFDKTTSMPSPMQSPIVSSTPSSVPFPSVTTNKGFLSSIPNKINNENTKTLISSFLSPLTERNINKPPNT